MAFEVTMPRLGWNMEEGALATWRKQDGDSVESGEILFEVESDKAVQEVEALESGILRIPPDSPATPIRVLSTSGSDSSKSRARMLFQIISVWCDTPTY